MQHDFSQIHSLVLGEAGCVQRLGKAEDPRVFHPGKSIEVVAGALGWNFGMSIEGVFGLDDSEFVQAVDLKHDMTN